MLLRMKFYTCIVTICFIIDCSCIADDDNTSNLSIPSKIPVVSSDSEVLQSLVDVLQLQGNVLKTRVQSLLLHNSNLSPQVQQVLDANSAIKSFPTDQAQLLQDLRDQSNHLQTASKSLLSLTYVLQLLLDSRQQLPSSANHETKIIEPSKESTTEQNISESIGCERIGRTDGSGLYPIRSSVADEPFYAFCQTITSDASRKDEAWTIILRRLNFYRNWTEYSNGFGYLAGDHWIGLEHVHELTSARPHELRIELEHVNGTIHYANYNNIEVSGKEKEYELGALGEYSGTAGDLLGYHSGRKFSTFDKNRNWEDCARRLESAGWFGNCYASNLFGRFSGKGYMWFRDVTLNGVRMMIRARK